MAESSRAKAPIQHPPPFDESPNDERNDEVEGDESGRLLITDTDEDDDVAPAQPSSPSTSIRILTASTLSFSVMAILFRIVTSIMFATVRYYYLPDRVSDGIKAIIAPVRWS